MSAALCMHHKQGHLSLLTEAISIVCVPWAVLAIARQTIGMHELS